jgi:hypothetical protein
MTGTANTMAVIGLGVMGAPMAAILIDAGYEVVGFNRSPLGQPCRRAGPAPRPQRNPGTPTCMKPSGTTLICRSSTHFPREMEERND